MLKTLDNLITTTERSFMNNLSGNVLDVGCGYLIHYDYYEKGILAGRINIVHCLDPNPTTTLVSKRVSTKIKNKFIFETNILEKIKLKRKYDNIILRYIFNHFLEKKECIKKLHSCLKEEGKIYFLEGVNKNQKSVLAESKNIPRVKNILEDFHYSKIKTNFKVNIGVYKKILSPKDFKKFEKETWKYYSNDPSTKDCDSEEIISLFRRNNFNIIYKSEGRAYGENTLQLILD